MLNLRLLEWRGLFPSPSSEPSAPPDPLHFQLLDVKEALGVPLRQLADMAGISYETLDELVGSGCGSLEMFCRVVKCLGLQVDVRSWDYKRIVPLGYAAEPSLLCKSLKDYKDAVLRHSVFSPSWGVISSTSIATIDRADPTVSLNQFSQYVDFVGAKARLVYVLGDPSRSPAIFIPILN